MVFWSLVSVICIEFGHVMRRANSLEKTLMLEKIEVRRRRGWQRTRWLDGITNLTDWSLSNLWEMVKDREAWRAAGHVVTKSQTRLSDWTRVYSVCNSVVTKCPPWWTVITGWCFHETTPEAGKLEQGQGLEAPPHLFPCVTCFYRRGNQWLLHIINKFFITLSPTYENIID